MLSVGIADDNQEFVDILREFIDSQPDMAVCGVAYNGRDALKLVESHHPDVLILDIIMPLLDGLSVMEQLNEDRPRVPKIIMLTAFGQDEVVRRAMELGAAYFILKPFDITILADRIRQVAGLPSMTSFSAGARSVTHSTPTPSVPARSHIESAITKTLHEIGVPPHIKGYIYLREAIEIIYNNVEMLGAVHKTLYPRIADRFHTTPSRVERAIRHSIEVTWGRGNVEALRAVFGQSVMASRIKPTNTEFIAMIADKLRVTYSVN